MRKRNSGLAFDAEVNRCLRNEQACDVRTSELLDLKRKVDGEIRRVDAVALGKPVQYQLTKRIDHFTKLRKYLKTRWADPDVISLYVESEPDCQASAVADDLAWAALIIQTLPSYGQVPHFGLRVGDDAVFFNPYERLEELRLERESPERQQAFRRGLAHSFDKEGFTISGEDGANHFVHFIEVDDGAFRRLLRQSIDQEDASFSVSYYLCGKFARDVRLRP